MKNKIQKILQNKLGKENVKYLEIRYWSECQGRSDTGYSFNELEKGLDGNLYHGNTPVYKNYVFELNLEAAGFEEPGYFNAKAGIVEMGFTEEGAVESFVADLELLEIND